jgi:hypothetical protein
MRMTRPGTNIMVVGIFVIVIIVVLAIMLIIGE